MYIEDDYEDNQHRDRFFRGYVIMVIVLALIFAAILAFLWIKLDGYESKVTSKETGQELVSKVDEALGPNAEEIEKSQQQAFLAFVDGMSGQSLAPFWYNTHPEHFDNEDDVASFLNENIVNVPFERYKADDFAIDAPKYCLVYGGSVIAEMMLEGSVGEWSVSNVDIKLNGSLSGDVTVPKNTEGYINGALIPETYIVTEVAAEVDGYTDSLANAQVFDNYHVEGLISEPFITANSFEQMVCTTPAVDGRYYLILTEGADTYKNKADDFIKSLLHYYSAGKENAEGNLSSVLSHVASGSEAAKVINSSISGVVWTTAYAANYVTNTSDVYILADNCYCVDVDYRNDSEDASINSGEGVYRVYFLDEGNGYRIVQFAGM